MKNSFFYSYLRTSKKFIWLILATIIILSAIFIRTVPNYSKKYGFEIVHLWDYNKYHQGYCLAENRILDKEELYKRAAIEYFEKELEINKKINEWRAYNYGTSWKNDLDIAYYEFGDDINLDNWFEKTQNSYAEIYKTIKDDSEYKTLEKATNKLHKKLEIKK